MKKNQQTEHINFKKIVGEEKCYSLAIEERKNICLPPGNKLQKSQISQAHTLNLSLRKLMINPFNPM